MTVKRKPAVKQAGVEPKSEAVSSDIFQSAALFSNQVFFTNGAGGARLTFCEAIGGQTFVRTAVHLPTETAQKLAELIAGNLKA